MPLSGASYTGPKEISYLFIDAEQLNCTLKDVGNYWFGESIELDYAALQGGHQKVFYYDCLPAQKANEAPEQYKQREAEKVSFFNRLRALPGWHVSQGLAKHRKGRQVQKEVDILIAVDVLTHTHRRNMHRMTFLSGDQDFAPLIEAVVREGMYVELLYQQKHVAEDLLYFSDKSTPLTVDYLFACSTSSFRQRHSLPSSEYVYPTSKVLGREFARGYRDGKLVASLYRGSGLPQAFMCWSERHEDSFLVFRHSDSEFLMKYGTYRLGENDLEWQTESGAVFTVADSD